MKVAGAALRGILRKITAVSLTFAQCSVEKFSVVHSVLGELCSCVFAQCSTWCNIVKKSAHSAMWAVQLCRVECCSAGSQLSAAGGVVVYLHRKDRWCAGWSDDDDELSWIMNYHLALHCSDCTEVLNLTVEQLHCSWMVQSSVNCWCCWSSSNGRWGIEDDDDKGSSSFMYCNTKLYCSVSWSCLSSSNGQRPQCAWYISPILWIWSLEWSGCRGMMTMMINCHHKHRFVCQLATYLYYMIVW